MTLLSSLIPKVIWKIKRDEIFPHYVEVYDILGRKIMQFDPKSFDVYDGNGNKFEDDIV